MNPLINRLKNLRTNPDNAPNVTFGSDFDDGSQENPKSYCEGGYHPVTIGATFQNKYTVVRKLGWGRFSTVWMCRDLQHSRFVALKIVRSASHTTTKARIEIELLNSVHEFDTARSRPSKIIKLLDHFELTGVNGTHVCIVLELLGPNLMKLCRRFRFKGIPLNDVKSVIRQVLEGLDYLHDTCNIIHTDIKPENICFDENENEISITLADLGNACWTDHHFSDAIQSRPYRAPEAVLLEDYGPSADIWSVACLAFELATGDFLFEPRGGKYYSRDEDHLALIVGLLGDVPRSVAFYSKFSKGFFTSRGKLRHCYSGCGLYEKLTKKYRWDVVNAGEFSSFLLMMLAIDPNERSSAKVCLRHDWLKKPCELKSVYVYAAILFILLVFVGLCGFDLFGK